MSTPEGRVKAKVKRVLAKFEVYAFWPVQMGYGSHTLDCLGCHAGRFFAIETKAPGKKPTVRQQQVIDDMRRKKGTVFVIDGSDEGFELLENWLRSKEHEDKNTRKNVPKGRVQKRSGGKASVKRIR